MSESGTVSCLARGSDDKCNILSLPEAILGEILKNLNLREQSLLLAACVSLWKLREDLESIVDSLHIEKEDIHALMAPSVQVSCRQLFFSRFLGLRHLDLGAHATDELLELISGRDGRGMELLQNLEHIDMSRSKEVTDGGLRSLSVGEARARNLRSIDVTFCRNTTYSGTFPLREKLENLAVIRRQPEWMDGRFLTPFQDSKDDGMVEAHTYWADGSFSFNRSNQSSGFVCDLFQCGSSPDHVGDKLQFLDFVPPAGWPDWSRFCYRPGVSLLRIPNESIGGVSVRSVLVAQSNAGLRPPLAHPVHEHANSVPLGESRFFGEDGELLPNGPELSVRHTMVTRMRVENLPDGSLMPPQDLVKRNKEFCDSMNELALEWIHYEEVLHRALGGGSD